MNTLTKLFGSELRVKMMRLFLFNPGVYLDFEYISKKAQARPREIEKELDFLKKLGLIRSDKKALSFSQKKKVKVFTLDSKFEFVQSLTDFLINTHSLEHKTILKKIEKTGRIKAVLLAGIFIQDPESRLDLLVVGDGVKSEAVDRIVKNIESDMGKDIRYAVLSVPDFAYRLSMNDKLIRDVLDFPHQVLVDKIGVSKI